MLLHWFHASITFSSILHGVERGLEFACRSRRSDNREKRLFDSLSLSLPLFFSFSRDNVIVDSGKSFSVTLCLALKINRITNDDPPTTWYFIDLSRNRLDVNYGTEVIRVVVPLQIYHHWNDHSPRILTLTSGKNFYGIFPLPCQINFVEIIRVFTMYSL